MKALPILARTLTVLIFGWLIAQPVSAATAVWSGAGANGNWSTAANWTGATPAPATDVKFYDPGTAVINVVDTTQSINSLQYGNTNNTHITQINPGVVLTNLGNLMAGTETDFGGVVLITSNVITGAGGTLVMSNSGANIIVRQGANGVTGAGATLDMTGLDTFTATIGRVQIGDAGINRSTGILLLAKTNQITASGTSPAISVGLSGSNNGAGRSTTLGLGQTNAIFANNIAVGRQKETAVSMIFNTTAFPDNPVAYFRGLDGVGRVATWSIGDGESNSGTTSCNGTCNFTGGTVDAMVGGMTVGRASNNTGGTGQSRGTLTFDRGVIDVNTLQVGFQTAASGAKYGDGTVNVRGNALLIVNTSLQLGVANNSTNISVGKLNIDGGRVEAYAVSTSTNSSASSPSPITLNNGGSLLIGTTAGTPAVPLSDLTLNDSLLGIGVVNVQVTNVVVNNLTIGGLTNVISIDTFPGIVSYPVKYRLIKSANPVTLTSGFFNIGLTNLPTGYSAYLTLDTAANAVDLMVTAGPLAQNVTWSGAVNNLWDATTANWLTDGLPNNYASGDFALFDDTATGSTTVNLKTVVYPSTVTVNNTSKAYIFAGTGGISGDTGLTKNGANSLTISNSGVNDFAGAINLNAGSLIYARNDDITVANVISGGGTLQKSGIGLLALNGANSAFTGAVVVAQGKLSAGNGSALGTTNGATIISDGATLDVNGQDLGAEPVTVSGGGVGLAGAIVNTGAAQQNALHYVTLGDDTTFGGTQRWDIRSGNTGDPSGAGLSTGGNAYKLTKVGVGTVGLIGATVDPALGDVEIQQGTLAVESGTTGLGDPTKALTVRAGGTLQLYNTTNLVNKVISFTGDGVTNSINSASGANTIVGPITLSGNCLFNVGGVSLTVNSAIGGSGALTKYGGSYLYLNGDNTFSGPITITSGTVAFNGMNTGGGLVTNFPNSTIVGSGSVTASVQLSGRLNPGDVGVAGTLGTGPLALNPTAVLTFDLAAVNTTGSGVNDLLEVNGTLTSTSTNPIAVNLLQGTLQAGTYRLINCVGTAAGLNTNVVLALGGISRYDLRVDTNTPGQVNLVVGGSAANLKWNSTSSSVWDIATTANWLNLASSSPAAFYQADSVLLDDSVSGVQPNVSLMASVAPSSITNNSDVNNFSITGAGKVTGGAAIVKQGASTLLVGTANDFVGPVLIQGGILQVTNNASLGSTNGPTIISAGATLDLLGTPANNVLNLGQEPILVSGSGVGGNGAIINSGANQQYNSIRNITLTGDTWFGGPGQWATSGNNPGRWDVRGAPAALSTTGHPYNLYKVGQNQVSIVAATVDPMLANIDVQQGLLGFETTTTSMGNPTNTLTVRAGATLSFYNTTPLWDKVLVLYGDGANTNVYNWSGSNTFAGPVTLNGDCVVAVRGTSLAFTGVIGGPGSLLKTQPNPLYLYGANAYSGSTQVKAGTLFLAGSGSVASPLVSVSSGATLDVTTRNDDTFTLSAGQTLGGGGTVNGLVVAGPGSVIMPGDATGTTLVINSNLTLNASSNVFQLGGAMGDALLAVSNNLVMSGVTRLYVAPTSLMNVGDTRTVIYYGGNLSGIAANFQVDATPGYTFVLDLSMPHLVQVRATSIPVTTYWMGGQPGGPTLWDTTTFNWSQDQFTRTNYSNPQVVTFGESPVPATNWVSLVGTLNPAAVVFNNFSTPYTLAGSGRLTGGGSLTLQGGAPVVLDNSGSNDYSGPTKITFGTLQVGNGDAQGNLGTDGVSIDYAGVLIFKRTDAVDVPNSISGFGSVTNLGTGSVMLSGSNGLSGEFTVGKGTLVVNHNYALGGPGMSGGTTVSNGATLSVSAPRLAENALTLSNEVITVSGAGVDGKGAIVNTGTNRQYNALRTVVMTGDTTFGGAGSWSTAAQPGRWDIRGSVANSYLKTGDIMTGPRPYNLTKTGSNQVSLVSVAIDSTPTLSLANIDVQQGLLGLEANTTSIGDVNSNLTVRAGAAISFYNTTNLWNKVFVFYGDGYNTNVFNWSGNNTIVGPVTLNGDCVFAVPVGSFTNAGPLGGPGGLVKNNAGLLVLSGAINYAGNTTVNDGRLLPLTALPASPVFDLAGSTGILDLSAVGGNLALGNAQTVRGNGTIWGSLNAGVGSTVAPGESVGTLTVTNGVTLAGSTVMEIDKSAPAINDQLSTPKNIVLGGTLTVANVGATPLAGGDSFKLFSAASLSGSFTATNLPSPGAGKAWDASLLNSQGVLKVVNTVSLTPTNVTVVVTNNGTALGISWPADHTGWYLQIQTNTLSTGLARNWSTVPGSSSTNLVVVPIDLANGSVFCRLVITNSP